MNFHSAADIFPLMDGAEFAELVSDICANGLQEPIKVDKATSTIIDGRNRYRACIEAGVMPEFEPWEGDNPVAYVLSLNLHRRHLNESQRAMIAAKIANMQRGDNQHASIEATSQTEAAKQLQVGRSSVQRAKEVIEEGSPELIEAIEKGKVSVSTAATITDLPKEEQAEIVARGEKEILAKAKEIRAVKNAARRVERIKAINDTLQEPTPLTEINTRFPIIYADPPWEYDFSKDSSDEIEEHYPPMAVTERPIACL